MTTAGHVAFEAYRKSAGGTAHNGEPIPGWMMVKQSVRDAWGAAAYAVRTRDEAMRDRKEVEDKLSFLVGILAISDPNEEPIIRVHARALDLIWVLHPWFVFNQSHIHLDELIEERRASIAGADPRYMGCVSVDDLSDDRPARL